MNDKTKTALIIVGAVVAVGAAIFMGVNSLKDGSQPVDSPGYAKLSEEERVRIRKEVLAKRAGLGKAGESNTTTAPATKP